MVLSLLDSEPVAPNRLTATPFLYKPSIILSCLKIHFPKVAINEFVAEKYESFLFHCSQQQNSAECDKKYMIPPSFQLYQANKSLISNMFCISFIY